MLIGNLTLVIIVVAARQSLSQEISRCCGDSLQGFVFNAASVFCFGVNLVNPLMFFRKELKTFSFFPEEL